MTTPAAVDDCKRATLKIFQDDSYKLYAVEIHWQFSEESLTTKRPLHHSAIMCISRETDGDGKLLSYFSNSNVFMRLAVAGIVPALATKDYVNPHSNVTLDYRRGQRNLGESAENKQWISGGGMYQKACFVWRCCFGAYCLVGAPLLAEGHAPQPSAQCDSGGYVALRWHSSIGCHRGTP